LLRYLATRDDVRIAGPTTDHLGRPGVEVRMTERYRLDTSEVEREDEFRFVFHTGTGSLLSAETLILDGPRQSPAVPPPFSETVILWLETGRVDSVGQRPSGS
jgi:hypothetical protein